MNSFDSFTLSPMTAGDIIDRAVRIYRRNFMALLRIVILPSLVAYAGLILIAIGMRNASTTRGDARIALTFVLVTTGGILYLVGKAAFYAVLGGASRSLVHHFFDGTPLRARDVFRAVRARFWSLVGATVVVALLVIGFAMVIYFAAAMLMMLYFALMIGVITSLSYWLQLTLNIIFGTALVTGVAISLLLVYSRIVYVPQVLMVEGKGVINSINRSFSLAGGEVRRIAALILFWFYVAWSIWILLMIPLGWYGYWMGVDINPFGAEEPFWYNISQQTLTQLNEILIAPIAMLGFTLLYLDSRVRKEGFDVELLVNRILPPPREGQPVRSVHPVSEPEAVAARTSWVPSVLGLGDIRPGHVAVSDPPLESIKTDEITTAGFVEDEKSERLTYSEGQTHQPLELPQYEPPPAVRPHPAPVVAPAPILSQRTCRYCNSPAEVEDRFCRVCGSLF